MRVLAVTGMSGVGKTRVAGQLRELLPRWISLSIDGERRRGGDWSTLAVKVQGLAANAIVESIAMPAPYLHALRFHTVRVVVVTCDEAERLRRCRARGGRGGSRSYSRPNAWVLDNTVAVPAEELERVAAWAAA